MAPDWAVSRRRRVLGMSYGAAGARHRMKPWESERGTPIGTNLPLEVDHAALLCVHGGLVHQTSARSRGSAPEECRHNRFRASLQPLTVLHQWKRRQGVPDLSTFSAARVEVRPAHLSPFSTGGNDAGPCQSSR